MPSATIVRCQDCGVPVPESAAGWLRCPDCDRAFCPDCPSAHRQITMIHGECDSTQACPFCGAICLVDY